MIAQENLDALIASLEEYKKSGVRDPWLMSDGTEIEPLDALRELRELRAEEKETRAFKLLAELYRLCSENPPDWYHSSDFITEIDDYFKGVDGEI